MALKPSELIWYAAANMPEDDVSPSGGGIDTTTLIAVDAAAKAGPNSAELFQKFASTPRLTSTADGDIGINATVHGYDAGGAIVQETLALNGGTPVYGDQRFESLLKIVLDQPASGKVKLTTADGAGHAAFLPAGGILTVRRIFYDVAAPGSGEKDVYEKLFLRNENAETALLGVSIEMNLPFFFDTAVEDVQDGNGQVANRLTEPTGVTSAGFSAADKAIPGMNLAPSAAIGVWIKLPAHDVTEEIPTLTGRGKAG